MAGAPGKVDRRLLVSAEEAAELCGVSERFWASLDAAGKVPMPRKLGRRILWSLAEIEKWVADGCPSRDHG